MAARIEPRRVVSENRKARFEFELIETVEAGLVLSGSEVKALRLGRANIAEAYASEHGGEIFLINAYIPEYGAANRFNHETRRPRKLLLHRRQINRLMGAVRRDGMTLAPLKLYFDDRGRAKLEIALAKGKKTHDKRETAKNRDWERQRARLLKDRG
jgi:SsrA-binding protein